MIRRKTGFKGCTVLGVLSASLIAVACSDDEDLIDGGAGSAGTAGTSSTAGRSSGGSSTAGSSTAGSSTAGSSTAGSSNGGTPGTGGTSGGSAGSGMAGAHDAGGNGGDSAGAAGGGGAGEGGEPSMSGGGEGGAEAGGASGAGGAGGEGGAPFVPDVLDNPGFEVGTPHADIPGWTNEGTANAAYIEYADPHSGFGKLGHWTKWENAQSPPYTARTFQTVSPIANGTYSFSVWVKRDWFDVQYLFATGFNADDLDDEVTVETDDAEAPTGYVKITLSGIVVTSGSCTVGMYSSAPAGTFANFDDAELVLQ